MPRKKHLTLTETVEGFLADLRLSPAEEVRAALARLLAESVEEAPAYARAKLAAELRELVTELESSEMEEPKAPRLLRGLDAG
jgi:hypothetical protein